ncbi:MAG: hypothetical protein M3N91_20050 [Pseudomonadota bacterium]|nr:hypothetical protein [Pseudomonadota bacterium]
MATLLVSALAPALDAYYAQQSAETAQRMHALNRELETRSAELLVGFGKHPYIATSIFAVRLSFLSRNT